MEFAFIVIGTLLLFIGLFSYKIVPASKIGIVEYLGAYSRTIDTPGVHLIKPFVDKMHLIDRLTVLEIRNAIISLNGKKDFEVSFDLSFEVLDAKLYYYYQKDPKRSIKDLCLKEARIYMSEHQVYDILETKIGLKEQLIKFMNTLEKSYFIELKDLDLISLVKRNENI